ncbi:MAG: 30S ribosomal protein S3 [Firmicutes bacterium]|nr:30S ribosomal protein S3 [Bacillota bacterium]
MGQKVHPIGFRVGVIKDWDGRWFAKKQEYANLILEDVKIRNYVKKRLYASGVAKIEIERAANRLKVTIHTARPGMVIGRQGTEVELIRKEIEKFSGKQVQLNIAEVKVPELTAQLVAENIGFQLERRVSFRRTMKQAIGRAMKLGAQGVKVSCSGRLMGAEIARTEGYSEGKVPLHTLRADIDYGFAEANTTYGKIGVKVWIYKGEILPAKKRVKAKAEGGV